MKLSGLAARVERLELESLPALPNGGIVMIGVKEGESEDDAKERTLAALGLTERQPGICLIYCTDEELRLA